tara:strand:+ start:623 stop:1183 length:561 start_codon:yes stop_codon:yes gene_type:complete
MKGGYSAKVNPAASSASYASSPGAPGAASYVEGKYGNTNAQYNSVFDNSSKTLGNTFTTLPASQQPTPASLKLIQSAGGKKKRKKGSGLGLGEAVSTAAVPLGLLYLQNKYGKKSKSRKLSKTFKKKKGGYMIGSLKGGKSHKKRTKKRKGGMFSQILSTAAVPFTLLGLNHKYGKKSKKSKKSKK